MLWLKLAHVIVKGASGGHQSAYHDFELLILEYSFHAPVSESSLSGTSPNIEALRWYAISFVWIWHYVASRRTHHWYKTWLLILICVHIAVTLYMAWVRNCIPVHKLPCISTRSCTLWKSKLKPLFPFIDGSQYFSLAPDEILSSSQ